MSIENHVVKEGSRKHVVWWDECGRHCSELNCEINKKNKTISERKD